MPTPSVRQPALFLGHGNPMLAITANGYAPQWRALAARLPQPRAILVVSAHWYGGGTAVTAQPNPPTLHDFGGFPRALFEVQYPAPGDPALARRLVALLAPGIPVRLAEDWGFDHGAWSVLRHMYPEAQVPVVQLSIDGRQSAAWHFALGQRLAVLRDEGVVVLGSGNLVHNLGRIQWGDDVPALPWAVSADRWFAERILARDFAALCDPERFPGDVRLAVPTPEHYLPLLHVLGASDGRDTLSFPVTGMDIGAISMRCCLCLPTVVDASH